MKEEFTYQKVQEIINAEKYITDADGSFLSSKCFVFAFPVRYAFTLCSVNKQYKVFVKIYQSSKNALRISCHSQDEETKTQLFRIDYKSSHSNPKTATQTLPEVFKDFIAKEFLYESHVHYFVEGYKTLAWALPIEQTPFKELNEPTPVNIQNVIKEFCNAIHVQTNVVFDQITIF